MKISLKNKPLVYFSDHPGLIFMCMLIIIVSMVMVGAAQKEVVILDGTNKINFVVYKGTVRDVLEQTKVQLNPKDKVIPSLESAVKDGTRISIKRAVPVKVAIDGKELHFLSAEDTVMDMLSAEGITYGEKDIIRPEPDTIVSDNMEVRVVRVTEKEIIEKQKLAYTEEVQEVPEWERGVEKVLRKGSEGEKISTIKITYEDGVEKSREVVDEKIVKPPVNSLLAVGTLDWRTISRGETINFRKMLVMKATSYTDDIACTGKVGGNTATGVKPRRNSDGSKWSTVAVDPKVIPLGTKLWIEGYGYAIAEDVGGAVKGNIIDLFFTNGTQEYERWRTRRVKVYILK